MNQDIDAVLTQEGDTFWLTYTHPEYGYQEKKAVIPKRHHSRLYVTLFITPWRWWGWCSQLGVPFKIHKTNDYQYTGNAYTRNPRAEIRFQKTRDRQLIRIMKGKSRGS